MSTLNSLLALRDRWQPIETAPKDGTRILLVDERGGVFIGHWSDEATFGRFETKPGWQIFDCEDDFYSWRRVPTHWRPLPAPPVAADDKILARRDRPETEKAEHDTRVGGVPSDRPLGSTASDNEVK